MPKCVICDDPLGIATMARNEIIECSNCEINNQIMQVNPLVLNILGQDWGD